MEIASNKEMVIEVDQRRSNFRIWNLNTAVERDTSCSKDH